MKRIKIFDTTLRDGEQSPGCSMNLTEKIEMARQLEKLGVDISGPLLLHCRRRGRDDAECARHRRLLHAAGDV